MWHIGTTSMDHLRLPCSQWQRGHTPLLNALEVSSTKKLNLCNCIAIGSMSMQQFIPLHNRQMCKLCQVYVEKETVVIYHSMKMCTKVLDIMVIAR